jgi:hypothetical protein
MSGALGSRVLRQVERPNRAGSLSNIRAKALSRIEIAYLGHQAFPAIGQPHVSQSSTVATLSHSAMLRSHYRDPPIRAQTVNSGLKTGAISVAADPRPYHRAHPAIRLS